MPLRERMLVTGSRYGWTEEEVRNGLDRVRNDRGPGVRLTVVHGAATGVDTIADKWRMDQAFGLPEPYPVTPAEWKQFGYAAGPLRNKKMVDSRPDFAVAFLAEHSSGTSGCINFVKRANIDLYLFEKEKRIMKPVLKIINGTEEVWSA